MEQELLDVKSIHCAFLHGRCLVVLFIFIYRDTQCLHCSKIASYNKTLYKYLQTIYNFLLPYIRQTDNSVCVFFLFYSKFSITCSVIIYIAVSQRLTPRCAIGGKEPLPTPTFPLLTGRPSTAPALLLGPPGDNGSSAILPSNS